MLKGKSTIQLFDKNTGALQACYRDENMITNAISNMINPKAHFNFSSGNNAAALSKTTPLAVNSLGGLILWKTALPETAGTILPPAGCPEHAHAGTAYSGTTANRGSYNENESGEIDGGYRHVWDFGTDKANGSFAALSLTSRKGGNVGWSCSENTTQVVDDIVNMNSCTFSTSFARTLGACAASGYGVPAGRFAENVYTYLSGIGNVTVTNIACATADGLGLTRSVGNGAAQNKVLGQAVFTGTGRSDYFCVTPDGLIGLVKKNSAHSYTFTFIDPVELACVSSFSITTQYDYDILSDFHFKNNELYMKRSGSYLVDILSTSGVLRRSFTISNSAYVSMYNLGSALCCNGAQGMDYLNDDGEPIRLPSHNQITTHIFYDCAPHYPYVLCQYESGFYYGVISAYLATINNLDYVITKTDTQTMKITYELYND